jgi:hypothetical protein
MGDEVVTFGGRESIGVRLGLIFVYAGLTFIVFLLVRSSGYLYAALYCAGGLLLLAHYTYGLLMDPYKVTIRPGNLLIFRGLTRTRSVYLKICDGSSAAMQTPPRTWSVTWTFFFVTGSTRLNGEAGQSLTEYLCRMNPNIHVDDVSPIQKPTSPVKPKTVDEPEWVGEKLSAQELARRQREAERGFREQR